MRCTSRPNSPVVALLGLGLGAFGGLLAYAVLPLVLAALLVRRRDA